MSLISLLLCIALHRFLLGSAVRCLPNSELFSAPQSDSYNLEFHLLSLHVPSFTLTSCLFPGKLYPPICHHIFIGSCFYGYYDFIGKLLVHHRRITTAASRSFIAVMMSAVLAASPRCKNNNSVRLPTHSPIHPSVTEGFFGFRILSYSAPDGCLYRGSLSFGL